MTDSYAWPDPYRSVVDNDREEARTARNIDRDRYDDDKPSKSDLAYDAELDKERP